MMMESFVLHLIWCHVPNEEWQRWQEEVYSSHGGYTFCFIEQPNHRSCLPSFRIFVFAMIVESRVFESRLLYWIFLSAEHYHHRMTKSFVESSSQTVQTDPSNHVRNYKIAHSYNIEKLAQQDEIIDNDGNDIISHGPRSESLNQDQKLHRRLHPTRPDDFATLQSELLQWRCREERKITKTARNAAHKREMIKLLLRKESHLLRKIDQMRNSVTDKWKTEQVELMMEMMSKPKEWVDSQGFIIRVDTPETYRARMMKSMYDNLIETVDNGKYIIETHIHRFTTTCHL